MIRVPLLPALYVDGTDIIALNGTSSDTNIDIFDDYNSSNQHTGRTIVAGGSLQAEFSKHMELINTIPGT